MLSLSFAAGLLQSGVLVSMSDDETRNEVPSRKNSVPASLWVRCSGCQTTIFRTEAVRRMNVCPECSNYWHIPAWQRINQLFDTGTFEESDAHLAPADPLQFSDHQPYSDRIKADQLSTGLTESAITGVGRVSARRIAFGITDSRFIMGSMGSVFGEKFTRMIERATDEKLPLVHILCSGGGRMHEGIFSLMAFAKITAALARFHQSGGLYISVMTNPTLGGVAAFAMLADVVFAEPKALIGFAGPRAIKAALRAELPQGFQTSEFLLEHGYIDRIVQRHDLNTELARAVDYCGA